MHRTAGRARTARTKLPEHNPDVWAQQRISEGWTFVDKPNDADRTHPDLKPYDQLSNSKKQYDRNSVVQTLKLIIKFGYRIGKN